MDVKKKNIRGVILFDEDFELISQEYSLGFHENELVISDQNKLDFASKIAHSNNF